MGEPGGEDEEYCGEATGTKITELGKVVGSPCNNKVFSDRKNWCDDTDKYPDVTELEINGQSSIPIWGVILAGLGNFS